MLDESIVVTLVVHLGVVTISNDGATIMKLLDIVHPAAKTLVDIARSQDAEVGDGTTSVVLLAGELLKEVKGYIEEGVSPHVIIKGYRQAARLVRKCKCLLCSSNGLCVLICKILTR
jgi:T-complex protein 1 subunit eta